jgi:hypothetical protein
MIICRKSIITIVFLILLNPVAVWASLSNPECGPYQDAFAPQQVGQLSFQIHFCQDAKQPHHTKLFHLQACNVYGSHTVLALNCRLENRGDTEFNETSTETYTGFAGMLIRFRYLNKQDFNFPPIYLRSSALLL